MKPGVEREKFAEPVNVVVNLWKYLVAFPVADPEILKRTRKAGSVSATSYVIANMLYAFYTAKGA